MITDAKTINVSELTEDQPEQPRRWWILAVLCLVVLFITIDDIIVSVALPTLALKLAATASELQWIAEAYVLVLAGLLLTGGSLIDRYGSRTMLLIGLVGFGLASAASAFAPNAAFLIAGRAAMGVGGALMMPATLSVLRQTFSAKERPVAISVWAAVSSLGIVIGPLLGGWLLEHFWWGSIFLINLPIIGFAIIASLVLLPPGQKRPGSPVDYTGTLLSIGGMSSLVFGVIEGPVMGWFSPAIISTLLGSISLLVGFVIWERHTENPMLDLKLLRNPRFSIASLAVALAYFALFGTTFFLTQYLQFVLGLSPLEAGLRLIPVAISLTVAGLISPWLAGRLGTKLVVFSGLVLTAIGLLVFSTINLNNGEAVVLIMLVIVGAGIGLAAIPAADAIMGAVPKNQAGSAASVDETAIQLGGALGIAILGSILATSFTSKLEAIPELPPAAITSGATESIGAAVRLATELGGIPGQNLLELARRAFVEAIGETAQLGAGVALLGAFLALLFLPAQQTKAEIE